MNGAEGARIAVDLTPFAPNGVNGGLGLLTRTVLPRLLAALPNCEFILLTSFENHKFAAAFEAENAKRLCVIAEPVLGPDLVTRLALGAASALSRRSPLRVREWLLKSYWSRVQQKAGLDLMAAHKVHLVYSPLMSVRFLGRSPAVVVLPDLLFAEYPEYFAREDLWFREWQFWTARRLAAKIVCVSDHAKQVMVRNGVPPKAVEHIYPLVHHRIPQSTEAEIRERLSQFGLQPERYFLYPANTWPHKNHASLIDAYSAYCRDSGDKETQLVLTGAESAPGELPALLDRSGRHGNRVRYLGYLSDETYFAVLQGAKALVFPSRYEGFGQAVAEAMHCGVPVICGAVAALPEVAQDAALYCDPNHPGSITEALLRLNDPDLCDTLVRRGRARMRAMGTLEDMIRRYLRVFAEASSGATLGSRTGAPADDSPVV